MSLITLAAAITVLIVLAMYLKASDSKRRVLEVSVSSYAIAKLDILDVIKEMFEGDWLKVIIASPLYAIAVLLLIVFLAVSVSKLSNYLKYFENNVAEPQGDIGKKYGVSNNVVRGIAFTATIVLIAYLVISKNAALKFF